ncbi:MAG TPA: response regulator [Bacteroidota bacterium]|nr:response regulator [Bacteroidota bacterium]
MKTRQCNILIAEDNPGHQRLTQYALKKSRAPVRCAVVRDGQEILDYLTGRPPFEDRAAFPVPDLILLDLNLPKRDGREVLRLIKADPALAGIPVVVLSTSDREEDIRYAMEMGAADYISKSTGFDVYTSRISEVTRHVR